MPRVKRSVHARKKRRKVLQQARGYWGLKHSSYRRAKEQVEHSLTYAYRDRKNKKRTFRRLWIMRINAAARREGLSYNQFVSGLRKAEIPLDRKVLADLAVSDPAAFAKIAEQAKAALESLRRRLRRMTDKRQAEVFRRQAEHFEALGSPVYARLARRCATEPLVDELVDDLRWDVPLRLFGGVHYLELSGEEPYALSGDWEDFHRALVGRQGFLARFVREQAVQTNEVQRCFALLPAFLTLAREAGASALDLLELGPSAGLNLLWDRYAYAYRHRSWGSIRADAARGGVRAGPRRGAGDPASRFAPGAASI